MTSTRGVRYYITFADDATRRTTPPFMKEKGEATAKVKKYLEAQLEQKPKKLRATTGENISMTS
jgi:hypothetical protein